MDKRDLLKLLAAAGIGVAAGGALTHSDGKQIGISGGSARVERILAENKIRAAYIVYPPFLGKDSATGQLSGLCYDVAMAMAANLGIEIEWVEETFFGSATAGIETDRYDLIVANFWPNGKRARAADFVVPMFYSGLHVLVRADDSHFTGVADYAVFDSPNYTFSTIDGDISALVIQQMFPQAKVLSMPANGEYAQMLENVSTGKADIVMVETNIANSYIKSNPSKLRNLTATKPFQVYANCFMVRKGEEGLKAMLSIATEELLNTGAMDRILANYESKGTELYRIAHPYRMDDKA